MIEGTICAKATAEGIGALGIIRVSGKESIEVVNRIFKGKDLTKVDSHTVHYGFIENREKTETIDEVMVSVFHAPKTFTAENLVEITCHGSNYIQEQILSLLIANGARLAQPGEFTQRAFLNGRIDLSQAEAIADLIAAENKASHDVALNQMRGGISDELKELREKLINFTALIELELDFSEEDVEFANRKELQDLVYNLKGRIAQLLSSFEYGNAIKNGVPVAIIGKPNAGKSTLLNKLLNEERAIVSDIPGTTRDTIEEVLHWDGISFRFIDTAGLRDTEDVVEAIGVEKARQKITQSSIILYLFDRKDTSLEEIVAELKSFPQNKKVFLVSTKEDLYSDEDSEKFKQSLNDYQALFQSIVGISSKEDKNILNLKKMLVSTIKKDVDENSVIITNIRHKEALQNALNSLYKVEEGMSCGLIGDLLAFDLRESLFYLGSITGQIDVDKDILGTIFGKFCIGK